MYVVTLKKGSTLLTHGGFMTKAGALGFAARNTSRTTTATVTAAPHASTADTVRKGAAFAASLGF